MNIRIEPPPPIKRALVLSGGGAKGAYAFGCLKAFKEFGIHFDAVSGTSVGGLNAMLWSTDSMDEGQKLWDNLSFSTVYPVRFLNPQKCPKIILRGFAAVIVFLNLVAATLTGIKHPGSLIISLLLTIVFGFGFLWLLLGTLWSLIASIFLNPGIHTGDNLVFVLIFTFIPLFCLSRIFHGIYKANVEGNLNRAVKFSIYHLFLILIGIFIAFLPSSGDNLNPNLFVFLLLAIIIIVIGGHFLLQVPQLPEYIASIPAKMLKWAGTILDSTPLKNTCQRILSTRSIPIPTFITSASLKEVYLPYKTKFWISTDPKKTKIWIPVYKDISALAPDEAVFHSVATAALPFGIVPPVKIAERDFVDGGIVDNVPYHPFVYDMPAKEIFIVVLENFKSDAEAARRLKVTLEGWFKAAENIFWDNTLEHLRKFIPEDKEEHEIDYRDRQKAYEYKDEILSSYESLKEFKEQKVFPKLVIFYPKTRGLGNFLSGTLNFDGDYAKGIMKRGYLETIQRLNEMKAS